MQKSYVVKAPINFANFGFFVRVGDILVHDVANGNRLTVYRSGEIVKAITQTQLGMTALIKQGFVTELTSPPKPDTKPVEVLRAEIRKKAKAAVETIPEVLPEVKTHILWKKGDESKSEEL